MRKAELLYHAQLAAENNLTITPVFSNKTTPNSSCNLHQEPLNLVSAKSPNSMQSPFKALIADLDTSISINKPLNDLTVTTTSVSPEANTTTKPLKVSNTSSTTTNNGGFRRPRQVFTFEQEEELTNYVKDTSNYYCGLSSKEVRIMAFVYGVCNLVDMPAGWRESHQASFDWCVGFMKRNKIPSTIITGISTKSNGSSKQRQSSKIPNSNGPI